MSESGSSEPSRLDGILPDGFIKDQGDERLNNLPDVENDPFVGVKSMFDPDNSKTWVDYAVAYSLVYPYLVFLFACLGYAAFRIRKQYMLKKEQTLKEACTNCGAPVYLCAPHCPNCSKAHLNVRALSMGGYTKVGKHATHLHKCKLRRFRRCHFCAEYILVPRATDRCQHCGTEIFDGRDDLFAYNQYVQRRKWQVYGIVAIVSWVPVIGALVSCSFYRRVLIAPYASYMTFGWTSSLFVILAILRFLFRFLPFIGSIGIPVLAVAENYVYRNLFPSRVQAKKNTP